MSTYGNDLLMQYWLQQQSKLPGEYEEVEWLASYGAAKIDTGVFGGKDTLRIETNAMISGFNQYHGIYGCYTNESTNATRLILINTNNKTCYANSNTRASSPGTTGVFPANAWFDIIHEKTKIKVYQTETTIHQTQGTALASGKNIIDFNTNLTGAGTASLVFIRSQKIYDNGTLTRNFVPCIRKADNAPGFFDLCEKSFHGDADSYSRNAFIAKKFNSDVYSPSLDIHGYYISQTDGSLHESAYAAYTEAIPVTPGETYTYLKAYARNVTSSTYASAIAYSGPSTNDFMSSIASLSFGAGSLNPLSTTFTIPDGCHYIRLSHTPGNVAPYDLEGLFMCFKN